MSWFSSIFGGGGFQKGSLNVPPDAARDALSHENDSEITSPYFENAAFNISRQAARDLKSMQRLTINDRTVYDITGGDAVEDLGDRVGTIFGEIHMFCHGEERISVPVTKLLEQTVQSVITNDLAIKLGTRIPQTDGPPIETHSLTALDSAYNITIEDGRVVVVQELLMKKAPGIDGDPDESPTFFKAKIIMETTEQGIQSDPPEVKVRVGHTAECKTEVAARKASF